MTNQNDLMIRVVAMPADTNSSGDIFGGWLMSQMDLAAWICARKKTPHRLVTVIAHAERAKGGEQVQVTEGRFTLVALDADRNPAAILG